VVLAVLNADGLDGPVHDHEAVLVPLADDLAGFAFGDACEEPGNCTAVLKMEAVRCWGALVLLRGKC
jgi:hypothetical protein